MKHYYIDLKDKRINLKPEQVEKVFKALDNKDFRFIEIDDEKINIAFIKGIFRDYEKEDMEERTNKLKQQMGQIELFARQKTKGWDVWGNEVKSDIEL